MTIEWLDLSDNRFGSGTYLAVAAALRVNSSLRILYLHDNRAVDQVRIDAAFVEALQLNPVRPVESVWQLYDEDTDNDFKRLRAASKQRGHPSLQQLLARLLTDDRTTAKLRH